MPATAQELLEDAADQEAEAEKLDLAGVIALGKELEKLEAEAAVLEAELTAKNKQVGAIRSGKLPAALAALGITGVDLASGTRVEVAEVVKGAIGDDNRAPAHAWLRAHNFGDLIKNEVKVTFGKGEDEFAGALMKIINDLHEDEALKFGSLEQKEAVHTQTLYAFLRERLASGEAFPGELFKLDVFRVAKLKRGGVRG